MTAEARVQPRTLVDGLIFPEGPRWHRGSVYVSDMYGETIWRITLDGERTKVATVAGRPSGLSWLPDGSFIAVSMKEQRLVHIGDDGEVTTHADLSGLTSYECNDLVADPNGNLYVGEMGFDLVAGDQIGPGKILRSGADGRVSVAADGLMFPNGMVITDDRVLIVAESLGSKLTAFDIERDGELTNRRVWAPVDTPFLDGICLDAQHGVWVSTLYGNAFVRVVEGGEITHRVDTPGRWAVACALGGPDRRTLILATAETTNEDLEQLRSNGRVEIAEAPYSGAGCP